MSLKKGKKIRISEGNFFDNVTSDTKKMRWANPTNWINYSKLWLKVDFRAHNNVTLNSIEQTVTYTVLHIFRQVLFGAENQSNHQNFEKSLLSYKFWLIFIWMKQNFFFLKNIFKWPTQKNWDFQLPQFSIFFPKNFRNWSLG